jgi:hypothetical protein
MPQPSTVKRDNPWRFFRLGSVATLAAALLVCLALVVIQAVQNSWQFPPLRLEHRAFTSTGDNVAASAEPEVTAGTVVGRDAPALVLKDLDGLVVRLKDYLGKLPVVIEFGSYT